MEELPKELTDAFPMAIRFAKEISRAANTRWRSSGAKNSVLVSSLILQKFLILVLNSSRKTPKEGEEFIREFYTGAMNDAIGRWYLIKKS